MSEITISSATGPVPTCPSCGALMPQIAVHKDGVPVNQECYCKNTHLINKQAFGAFWQYMGVLRTTTQQSVTIARLDENLMLRVPMPLSDRGYVYVGINDLELVWIKENHIVTEESR